MRFHRPFRITRTSALVRASAPLRARTIASIGGSLCCCKRKDSRMRRFIRLRSWACLICFLAMTRPRRAIWGLGRQRNKKLGWLALMGASSKTRVYEVLSRSFCGLVKRNESFTESLEVIDALGPDETLVFNANHPGHWSLSSYQ